jgi:hypothetical protein
VDERVIAELAAALATVIATVAAIPQLHRVARAGDGRGVSVTSAVLGIGSELAWVMYATQAGLWSALPEAGLMAAGNTILVIALLRRQASARRAVPAGLAWVGALATIAIVGGPTALGAVLGVTYAVQVAPAVWTVWRTSSPSGVVSSTWAMIGAEGVLWGAYGLHHEDPAVLTFAATATLASAATLTRKLHVVRRSRAGGVAIGQGRRRDQPVDTERVEVTMPVGVSSIVTSTRPPWRSNDTIRLPGYSTR